MISVTLIDSMGSDLTTVNAARVSFGKVSEGEIIEFDLLHHDPEAIKASVAAYKAEGWVITSDLNNWKIIVKKPTQKDAKLISYLAEHKHFSPFGHAFASFHVKAPIFVARQLVKHKFLRINEVSRRYVTSEPEFYVPDVWRKMAENVKQGSSREQLVLEGVKVCKYCHTELNFLRKEDEKMKIFCSADCQGSFYRKYTDKGWATAKHSSLRESALKRSIPFDLTIQDIIEVGRPKFCKYLEIELDYASTKVAPNSPSVNRVNPSVGYVKGNLEVISNKANSMLLDATKEELKVFMKNVSLTQFGVFTETANSVDSFYGEMKQLYKRLVDGGMCAEQARMFMPTSQMTEFYWSGSLDAFADMCKLRCKDDTQYETRLVADQISKEMKQLFPVSWVALVGEEG